MNSHQRRIARRTYERAPHTYGQDDEDDYFGCQDCGDTISFADGTAYVTASGDAYCNSCGRANDEAEEAMMDEEAEAQGWWDYSHGSDLIEGEEYGVYIGKENDTMGGETE